MKFSKNLKESFIHSYLYQSETVIIIDILTKTSNLTISPKVNVSDTI